MEITLEDFVLTSIGTRSSVNATLVCPNGTRVHGAIRTIPLFERFGESGISEDAFGLYVLRDKLHNVFYIGSSVSLCKRRSEHARRIKKNKHQNNHLAAAFEYIPMHRIEFQYFHPSLNTGGKVKHYLRALEQEALDIFGKNPACLNVGMDAVSAMKGLPVPEETRKMISQSLTGHVHSEETRKKMGGSQRERLLAGLHPAFRKGHLEQLSDSIYLDGTAYRSVKEAIRLRNQTGRTIRLRLASNDPKWGNWYRVEDHWFK